MKKSDSIKTRKVISLLLCMSLLVQLLFSASGKMGGTQRELKGMAADGNTGAVSGSAIAVSGSAIAVTGSVFSYTPEDYQAANVNADPMNLLDRGVADNKAYYSKLNLETNGVKVSGNRINLRFDVALNQAALTAKLAQVTGNTASGLVTELQFGQDTALQERYGDYGTYLNQVGAAKGLDRVGFSCAFPANMVKLPPQAVTGGIIRITISGESEQKQIGRYELYKPENENGAIIYRCDFDNRVYALENVTCILGLSLLANNIKSNGQAVKFGATTGGAIFINLPGGYGPDLPEDVTEFTIDKRVAETNPKLHLNWYIDLNAVRKAGAPTDIALMPLAGKQFWDEFPAGLMPAGIGIKEGNAGYYRELPAYTINPDGSFHSATGAPAIALSAVQEAYRGSAAYQAMLDSEWSGDTIYPVNAAAGAASGCVLVLKRTEGSGSTAVSRYAVTYLVPEGTTETKLSFRLDSTLSGEEYQKMMKTTAEYKKAFSNKANLVTLSETGMTTDATTAAVSGTIQEQFFAKDGEPIGLSGRYYKWTLEAATYFNTDASVYVVDRISNNQVHDYNDTQININSDTMPVVTLDQIDASGNTELAAAKANLSGKDYSDMTNAALQTTGSVLLADLKLLTNDGTRAVRYNPAAVSNSSIMIIPVQSYINTPITISYGTEIKKMITDPNGLGSFQMRNDAKIIYKQLMYGTGTGTFVPTAEVGISKDKTADYVFVSKTVKPTYDAVQKKNVSYDKKTQGIIWNFQVNKVGVAIESIIITDELDLTKLEYTGLGSATITATGKNSEDGTSIESRDITYFDGSGTAPSGDYYSLTKTTGDAPKETLVVVMKNIPAKAVYSFDITTRLVDAGLLAKAVAGTASTLEKTITNAVSSSAELDSVSDPIISTVDADCTTDNKIIVKEPVVISGTGATAE